MTLRHPPALALLAALALGGCKLASLGEADVALELMSPALSRGRFTVVLRSADASEGTLYVDGVAQPGTLLPGEAHEFDVVPHGVHRLRCRAMVAGRPYHSNDVEVTVDTKPPRLLSSTGEVVQASGPLHVEAQFDEPLAAGTRLWTSGATFLASVAGDTVTADASPMNLAEPPVEVTVSVEARDAVGNGVIVRVARFMAPALPVQLASPDPGAISLASDSIRVVATFDPDVPVDLTADGLPFTRVRSGENLVDLRPLPDGVVRFGFDAEGWRPAGASFQVRIDHTRPEVVSCLPDLAPIDAPRAARGFVCHFTEVVRGVPDGGSVNDGTVWLIHPPRPAPGATSWTFDLAGTTDVAGNALGETTAFTFPFQAWTAPFGAGPVEVDGSVVRAAALAVENPLLVDLPGAPGAERLRRLVFPAPERPAWALEGWAYGPVADPSRLAGGDDVAAWLAPDGAGGTGIAGSCTFDQVTFRVLSLQGVEPASAELRGASKGSGGGCALVWSGAGASGVREAWVASQDPFDSRVFHPLRLGTGHDVPVLGLSLQLPWLAVVEPGVAGPGLLRVAPFLSWLEVPADSFGPPLNRDPALIATSPAVSGRFLAWTEGGTLLARVSDFAGGWSAPLVMNDDEAHPARLVRTMADWVVFVERHPDGDHVEARRWNSTTGQFEAYDDLVPGHEVSWLDLWRWDVERLDLVWLDAEGAIRHRRMNY